MKDKSESNLKVIAIIPARYGSTRFPGKPLASLNGRPMLSWVLDACTTCPYLSEVIVATDDARIAEVASQHRATAAQGLATTAANMNIPKISVEMTEAAIQTGTDRVLAALGTRTCDLVLNVQGDEPLLQPKILEDLILLMQKNPQIPMGTLASPIEPMEVSHPDIVKVLINEKSCATYFSRFPIPFSRGNQNPSGAAVPGLFKHIGLYAFQPEFLKQFCSWPQGEWEKSESLEQLRAIQKGFPIAVHAGDYPLIAVDQPEDIGKAEAVLRSRQ